MYVNEENAFSSTDRFSCARCYEVKVGGAFGYVQFAPHLSFRRDMCTPCAKAVKARREQRMRQELARMEQAGLTVGGKE